MLTMLKQCLNNVNNVNVLRNGEMISESEHHAFFRAKGTDKGFFLILFVEFFNYFW